MARSLRHPLPVRGCSDKQTIYPEYLPRPSLGAVTRLEQFAGYLKQREFSDFLDLSKSMIAAKDLGVLYYKIDAHWNMLGGWVGEREVVRRISEDLPIALEKPLSAYRVSDLPKSWGDLTLLMGLSGGFHDDDPLLEDLNLSPVQKARFDRGSVHGWVTTSGDYSLPKVLVFGDSFLETYLGDFLAEHFSRAVLIRSTDFDPEAIIQSNPDLVITETVERNLSSSIKATLPLPK